jgi:hypothetical protein
MPALTADRSSTLDYRSSTNPSTVGVFRSQSRGQKLFPLPDFQSGEGPTCLTFDSIKGAFTASTDKLQAIIDYKASARESQILQSRLHRTTGCVLDLSAAVQCFGQ